MELFKEVSKIDFMKLGRFTGAFSLLLCVISLGFLFTKGLSFGLEFTGGTQIELRFEEPADLSMIRHELERTGVEPRVQQYGSTKDVLIRVAASPDWATKAAVQERLSGVYEKVNGGLEVRRIEYVGSEVGQQLAEQGGLAVLVAILATMIYIALRFEYRFAISSALALTHDALIVLGIFALYQIEFDLPTLASILAVLGYSLNDTIVVFDRVRENFKKMRNESVAEIINASINQTLSRTIMTSFLTLLVVVALLVYGGSSLYGFSLVLFLGIIIGTYSSIFVAGSLALMFGLSKQDMMPKAKAAVDHLP